MLILIVNNDYVKEIDKSVKCQQTISIEDSPYNLEPEPVFIPRITEDERSPLRTVCANFVIRLLLQWYSINAQDKSVLRFGIYLLQPVFHLVISNHKDIAF